jgi:hypothetical protein
MKQKVKILMTLNPDGSCQLDTVKGAGKSCQKIADQMAKAVGVKPDETTRRNTPDLYVQPKQGVSQQIDVR